MKTSVFLRSLLALFFLPAFLQAENEIGFVEKFALAADREQVLGQLVPGSEDFYFYHALHFQNTRQLAKLKSAMEQWASRVPDSAQRRVIENREALLSFDADPQATLKFLKERLKLEFNHQQEARDQKPDLPTALNPEWISRERFQQEALMNSDDLGKFELPALEDLVRQNAKLSPAQRRALLSKLQWPDLPGLVGLIADDLQTEESKGFGEHGVHRALLPEQMDELAARVPALFESQAFVFARLRKMRPGADVDPEFNSAERQAWLERVWAYAKNLSPGFNTLKGHILFQQLLHDRARGVYDKGRFLEYLKLPRRQPYVV